MAGNLINALWITLIGMGLVFIAILALWGMMALIVRLTAEREGAEEAAESAAEEAEPAPETADLDRKRRAAAAAVAVAVAMQAQRPAEALKAAGPAGTVSAWQAVHRASQISQRVQTSRKKVVR